MSVFPNMNILVLGLNHKTAPIELRERFAFSQKEIENLLYSEASLKEMVILSTCNRVEIYSFGASEDAVKQWLCCRGDPAVALDDFSQHSYMLHGIEAVEHLMRVACGLDSLVLGEAEIFGQVKSAFSLACLHKTVGPQLSRLFRQTFSVAKKIRSSTKIGACPVSVASTAVMYLSEWWGNSPSPRILIIGVGEVGRLAAKHAQALTSHPVLVMSRHFINAQRVANEVRGIAIDFSQLQEYLSQVDVVISATSSNAIIISDEMVRHIDKALLMIDLAVPRDISSDVVKNSNITLCCLDQLKETIQNHVNVRAHAAMQAGRMIEEAAREFMLSLRTLESDEIIKRYRASMELHCEHELQKILQENRHATETALTLKDFSRNLLNKIMHIPSVQLQQASLEGRDDVLRSASEIFGIQGNTKQ